MSTAKSVKLSGKERRFIELFMGECAGNATAAALGAQYTANRKSAAEIGSRLLRKVKIAKALGKLLQKRTTESIAQADERDKVLTTILRAGTEESGTRIRAISEMNRCEGRHSIKHIVEGRLTLEQVLSESRTAIP